MAYRLADPETAREKIRIRGQPRDGGFLIRRIFDTQAIPSVPRLRATLEQLMRLDRREKGFSYDGIFVAHDRLRRVAVIYRIKCKHAETDRESEEIFDRR